VVVASSGQEAIALFDEAAGKVDLLLSDVIMPNMRGPELVAQLRRRNPALPVLFISGYTADALMRDGIASGEIEVLGKPFRPDVLAMRVRQLLDRMAVR
jgi:CheY-like chemotaxis protein